MPTPKQETMLESRTVVDQITNNYISLKWTNTDKKLMLLLFIPTVTGNN